MNVNRAVEVSFLLCTPFMPKVRTDAHSVFLDALLSAEGAGLKITQEKNLGFEYLYALFYGTDLRRRYFVIEQTTAADAQGVCF